MYRFMRSVQAKNAAFVAPAVAFAAGVCAYVNKTYKVDMHFGVEAFDKARIHWFMDFESVDKSMAMNRAMLQATSTRRCWTRPRHCGSKAACATLWLTCPPEPQRIVPTNETARRG